MCSFHSTDKKLNTRSGQLIVSCMYCVSVCVHTHVPLLKLIKIISHSLLELGFGNFPVSILGFLDRFGDVSECPGGWVGSDALSLRDSSEAIPQSRN